MRTAFALTKISRGFCLAAVFALAGAGCGSGTGRVLGTNSDVEVILTSRNVEDLELTVAPLRGAPTNPDVCSETQTGFGCTRRFNFGETVYFFTTTSQASAEPYHVYVRNLSDRARPAALEVIMDDTSKIVVDATIEPGETLRMARIFRNNADEF